MSEIESKSTKKVAPKVTLISALIIPVIALIVWFFGPDKTLTDFNNALFSIGILFGTAGSITALVSKSRRHYYLHLKRKFAGKETDSHEFNKEENNRVRHTRIGISVALGGVINIVICVILLYV